MTVNADVLLQVPLFQGMTDRALEALAAMATEVAFEQGATLTREGDEGDAFYLLLEGRTSVSRGNRVVREMGANEFFGEISLIDGRPRTATITALTPIRAVEIRRPGFQELLDRFAAVRLSLLMALAERIRADERDSPG